jgi:general secretion pathway protein M
MIAWMKNNRRFAGIVGLTLAVPLFFVLSILADFWGVRQDNQRQIDRLEPRLARLGGLLESEERLKKSSGKVGSQILQLVYPQSDDQATIAAALQTSVRDIISVAGLKVGNSRILPVKTEDGFERIGLSLTVSGEMDALDEVLADLAAYTPLLLVESIEIKPGRPARRGAESVGQAVIATMQLMTLRAAQ